MTARSWNNGPLGNTPITAAALNGMESDIATAVSSAAASATSAANSAALVGAPADTAIAAAIQGTSTQTAAALNAAYVGKLTELHVFICAGQSNMSGRGLPATGSYDPNDYRIFQYGAKVRTFRQATVPLDMGDTATGLSVATVFARKYLQSQPPGVGVLLVPAAVGATGLIRTDTTPGVWSPSYSGPYPILYNLMLTQTTEALAAATTATNLTPVLKGLLWHQGEAETDSGIYTEANYEAALDALIGGVRSTFSAPNLPCVIGGLVPEYSEGTSNYPAVRLALVGTVSRLSYVSYAEGVRGGGGSQNMNDGVHYHRAGVEILGARMESAYWRALANKAGSVPLTPSGLAASFIGGVLTVRWDQPLCRFTDFKIEYRIDGGAWTTITRAAGLAGHWTVVAGLSGTVAQVRVSTINDVGTSIPTASITASTTRVVMDEPMPSEPVLLTGVNLTTNLPTLNWEPSPNVLNYEIWRQENSGSGWGSPLKVTTRQRPTTSLVYSTALNSGWQYRHWLVLTNAGGSYTSNTLTHTIAGNPGTIPTAPSGVTQAVNTTTSITITWPTSMDSTVTANAIWQRRSTNGGTSWSAWGKNYTRPLADTSFGITGLTAGTTYEHYVTYVNPAGDSLPSNSVQFLAS